jgi:anaerobic magnesium-protoporphyrin IX monomethyl ester cyclase
VVKRALLVASAGETFLKEMTRRNSASHPLGLLSVAAALQFHGWEVRVLDMLLGVSRETLRRGVSDSRPDLLGISTSTEDFGGALAVAREARQVDPDLAVVVGGPHVSFEPEEALRSGLVDYVVMREGEATIIELTLALEGLIPVSKVRGVAYLEDDRLIVNPPRPFLERLDQLPLSPFRLAPAQGYVASTTIVSSRGCPGGCIFCASGALSGRRYRTRSAESLFSEVYYRCLKSSDDYFVLFDDTFTSDLDRAHHFCDLLLQSGRKLRWRCNSRVDRVDAALLDHLAMAGCVAIHYGIESGDQRILDSISKGVTLEEIERTVAETSARGMTAMCSFMIGHPADTEESVDKTLTLARRFRDQYRAVAAVSCLVPYPGTAVWRNAERLGITIEAKSWSAFDINNVIISTRNLSQDRLRELAFEVQGLVFSK